MLMPVLTPMPATVPLMTTAAVDQPQTGRQDSDTTDGGAARRTRRDRSGSRRPVAFLRCAGRSRGSEHDYASKAAVARAIAALLDVDYLGEVDAEQVDPGWIAQRPYWVPSHTLEPRDAPAALGIAGPQDCFGGWVPHGFIGSKLISHALVSPDAQAPEGWSSEFGNAARELVLPGRSVFTPADARRAADELFPLGSIRVKEPDGVGGSGQIVVDDADGLARCLDRLGAERLRREGLVLEQNLRDDVTTCSVGQVRVGPWLASYHGTQCNTRNGRGHEVYGGSTLSVTLGGFDTLVASGLDDTVRVAVEQAVAFHAGVQRCYPGMHASRCNYDVIQGRDANGVWRSGVLEQSWRVGGASGAEIAALQAFADDDRVGAVRASTCERYGTAGDAVPEGAQIRFDGVDQHGDRLVKFVQVESRAAPRHAQKEAMPEHVHD